MRSSSLTLIAAAILSAIACQSAAFAADPIGKVVAIVGTPSASGPGGDRNLKAGAAVYEDDKIEVSNGNAQIILADGTRLVIGPGSTLVLDRFLMTGGDTAEKVSIKALRGTFRFITGRSAKAAYDIQTANATIGIRGTGFDFWSQKQTGVAVLEGSVKLCRDDKCVDLHEGCELGRTTADESDKLEGRLKGRLIVNNLPYILNQDSLRTAFRLPIKDCNSSLPREREGGGNLKENNNQRGGDK